MQQKNFPPQTLLPSVTIEKHIIDKSSSVDLTNHTITWTLTINKKNLDLNDIVVTDKIEDGMTYVDGSLEASGATFNEYNADTKTITVKYGGTTSSAKTIKYKTTINDPKLWATNNNDSSTLKNRADLASTSITGANFSENTAIVDSVVLEKTGKGYSVPTRRITWELKVNQNKMSMTNPVITDKISDGEVFVANSIVDNGNVIKEFSYDKNTNTLTIKLNDLTNVGTASNYPTITFETEITDYSIFQKSKKETVKRTNTATLTCTEMGGLSTNSEEASRSVTVQPFMTKSGTAKASESSIAWTVRINDNLLPLTKPVLIDNLQEGLVLREDTIKLKKLNFNATGVVSPSGGTIVDASKYTTSYENGVFKFMFNEDITDPYELTFSTYFLKDGKYNNSIEFENAIEGEFTASIASDLTVADGSGGSALKKGKIVVTNTDADGNPIQGAKIKLGSSEIETTDADGKVTFDELFKGTYTIVQTSVGEDYILNDTSQKVILTAGATKEITIKNTVIKGNLKVTVKDISQTPATLLSGAEITLYKVKDNVETLVETKTTDVTGAVTFQDLKGGSYVAKQTKATTGYTAKKDPFEFSITVENNGLIQEWNIENEKKKSTLTVTNTEDPTGKVLQNSDIKVTSKTNPLVTYSKNAGTEGKAIFEGLNTGEYIIEQVKAPEGYILNTEKLTATIQNPGDEAFAEIKNKKIKAHLEATRKFVDEGNTTYLEGSKIAVYRIDGESEILVSENTTDSNGKVKFENLEYGKYVAKEIAAPTGYILSTEKYEFSVGEADNEKTFTWELETNKIKGSLKVINKDIDTTVTLSGAEITVISDKDPNVVYTQTIGINKEVLFEHLNYGSYTIKQTKPPVGYALSKDTVAVEIKENDSVITKEVYNKLIKGNLEVTKKFVTDGVETAIENVEISIYQIKDGVPTFIRKAKTDSAGKVTFSDLKEGDYVAKETFMPPCFILGTEEYSFSVKEETNGKTHIWDSVKSKITGNLKVTNKDVDTKALLSGAEITVISDKNPSVSYTKKIETNGEVLFESLQCGKYTMKQTKPPIGYALSKDTVAVEIKENGKLVTAEVSNKLIKGNLEVTEKFTAAGIQTPIANVEISVYQIKGNDKTLVTKGTTDSIGRVIFRDLKEGEYMAEETSVPPCFIQSTEKYSFSVNAETNGKTHVWDCVKGKVTGNLKVTNIDADTKELLSGAEITVISNKNPNISYIEKIQANGEVLFENLQCGTYTIKQTLAPNGYDISEDIQMIEIKENGKLVTAQVTNKKSIGSLKVTVKESNSTTTIQGSKVALYKKDGTLLEEKLTNQNGTVTFEKLLKGEYYYKQTEVPSKYKLNETAFSFKIDTEHTAEEGIITNNKKSSSSGGGGGGSSSNNNNNNNNNQNQNTNTDNNQNTNTDNNQNTNIDNNQNTNIDDNQNTNIDNNQNVNTDNTPDINIKNSEENIVNPSANSFNELLKADTKLSDIADKNDLTVAEEPASGILTIDADNNWVYTPKDGFVGKDIVKIAAKDSAGNETIMTVQVEVSEEGFQTFTILSYGIALDSYAQQQDKEVNFEQEDNENEDVLNNTAANYANNLPKTGESSRLPFYLIGIMFIGLGCIVLKRNSNKKV